MSGLNPQHSSLNWSAMECQFTYIGHSSWSDYIWCFRHNWSRSVVLLPVTKNRGIEGWIQEDTKLVCYQVGTLPPMRVVTYVPPEWGWISNKPPRCGWKPIFHLNGGEPVSAHPNPSGRPIYLTVMLIFR